MHDALKERLIDLLTPRPRVGITEWCKQNVYFPPSYASPYQGNYDPLLLPFWREPMEAIVDPSIDEIICLKAIQSGGSTYQIASLMYLLANEPASIFYLGPRQEAVEEFQRERIEPLLKASPALRKSYVDAVESEQGSKRGKVIALGNGSNLFCVNAGSLADLKSRPVKYIFADEVDAFNDLALDKVRGRLTHYRDIGAKLVAISAPDINAKKDKKTGKTPIFHEFDKTDKRHYYITDPATGEEFCLEWGGDIQDGKTSAWGIKWDKDALPDVNRVRDTVRFVSPNGKSYTQDEIRPLIKNGKWRATVTDTSKYDIRKRGYRINALYYRSWGDMAVEFLEAKHGGALKLTSWVAENLAQEIWLERKRVALTKLTEREADYGKQEWFYDAPSLIDTYKEQDKLRLITFDVQKRGIWWLATAITSNGDIGITSYGYVEAWENLNEVVKKYQVHACFGDSSYELRHAEMIQACHQYGWVPCWSNKDNKNYPLYELKAVDPYEGSRAQGSNSIQEIRYYALPLKHANLDRLMGFGEKKLYVYSRHELELGMQICSEELRDGQFVQLHKDNHLWDCLTLALLAARITGYDKLVTLQGAGTNAEQQ